MRDWLRDFSTPIQMKYVRFARELLQNPIFEKDIPSGYAIRTDGNYIIKDCYVTGFTVKEKDNKDRGAVFFKIDTDTSL